MPQTALQQMSEKMAAKVAHHIWEGLGKLLGHATLATGAYALHATASAAPQTRLQKIRSWLNPLPKLKGLATWGTLEAVSMIDEVRKPFAYAWEKLAPIAEKAMIPTLTLGTRWLVKGLMALGMSLPTTSEPPVSPKSPSWFDYESIRSNWRPNFFSTTSSASTSAASASTSAAPMPSVEEGYHNVTQLIRELYATANAHAPDVGQAVAETVKAVAKHGTEIANYPANTLKQIAEKFNIPYPYVVAGAVGVGILSYALLRYGFGRMTQKQKVKVDVKNDAKSRAEGGHARAEQRIQIVNVLPNGQPHAPARQASQVLTPEILQALAEVLQNPQAFRRSEAGAPLLLQAPQNPVAEEVENDDDEIVEMDALPLTKKTKGCTIC